MATSTHNSTKLGDLMVKEGLISSEDLQKALFAQQQSEGYRPLGKVCVDLKLITKPDLQRFLSKYHKRIQIGELLMHMGLINGEQLQEVLSQQRNNGERLGSLLVKSGVISESQLTDALSMQLDIPRILPSLELISPELLKGLEESFLRQYEFLPIHRHGNQMVVVMADPLNSELLQILVDHFKCRMMPAIAPASDIRAAINELFQNSPQSVVPPQQEALPEELSSINSFNHETKEQVTPIANYLIRSAVEANASALHVETQEKYMRIRLRINGILQHKTDLPLRLGPALLDCLRAPFKLKNEKYWQEHVRTRVNQQQVDLSISSFKGLWGENLVMHMVHTPTRILGLDNLGFSPLQAQRYTRLLERAGGLTIVAAPARSGKSTLIYASLLHLNEAERSIIALEDNPFFALPGVIQGKYSPDQTDRFSALIEAMTDYDADVMLVGHLQDPAHFFPVMQATLLGRKVFSSLKAADTTSALYYLLENNGKQLLLSPNPITLITPRLVRRLCDDCKTTYIPSEADYHHLNIHPLDRENYPLYRAVGCSHCQNQGYRGVMALYEFFELTPVVREAISRNHTASAIHQLARKSGNLLSLIEDGLYKAMQGLTTLEEIQRVAISYETDLTGSSLKEIHSRSHRPTHPLEA